MQQVASASKNPFNFAVSFLLQFAMRKKVPAQVGDQTSGIVI
jgi:hypothetical protein